MGTRCSEDPCVRGVAALAIAVLPYIGGITGGYVSPRAAIIVTVGSALWLCQVLAYYSFARGQRTKNKYPCLYPLTTLFTFGVAYGSAVAIVAFTLHGR